MKNNPEKSQADSKDENTVYISNLSYKIDRFMLKKIFSSFGEVKQVKLLMNLETQKSKGMAFIRMSKASEAKKAIAELNQQIIDGRTVKVSPAIPMKKAPASKFKEEKKVIKEIVKEKRPDKPEKAAKRGPVPLKTFLAEKERRKAKN